MKIWKDGDFKINAELNRLEAKCLKKFADPLGWGEYWCRSILQWRWKPKNRKTAMTMARKQRSRFQWWKLKSWTKSTFRYADGRIGPK